VGGPIFFLFAFLVGVFVHSLFPFVPFDIRWIGLSIVVCTIGVMRRSRFRRWIGLVLCLLLGLWRFEVSLPNGDSFEDGRAQFEGVIVRSLSSWTVVRVGAHGHAPGSTVPIAVKGLPKALIHSRISFECAPRRVLKTPGFDRRTWFARYGVFFECTAVEARVIAKPSVWDPIPRLAAWKEFISKRIRHRLPGDQAELLIGVLYGSPSFSPEELDRFRRAGLMHLVAVSGSNVSIVVTVLFFVLLRMGCRRRIAFWISSFFVLVYVVFVGLGASVIRAAIMAWLLLLGRDVGRIADSKYLLLLCAVVMNAWNPWQSAFDPGFILSFLAMIGLLFLTPPLSERLKWIPERFALRETVVTTISATMCTLPYSAWTFGTMSLAGLLTNVFAVPLIPWVMASGACSAVISIEVLSQPCTMVASGFLKGILSVAILADVFPFLSGAITFSFPLMLTTYIFLWKWMRSLRETIHSGDIDCVYQRLDVDRVEQKIPRQKKSFFRAFSFFSRFMSK